MIKEEKAPPVEPPKPLRYLEKVVKPIPPPPTPAVDAADDEEEERELATIFLQQVIRGRAIQNMVFRLQLCKIVLCINIAVLKFAISFKCDFSIDY